MKNLFKSMMLVAVAAMAFTACQNDNSEIDTLAKTRVVTFTANIGEDTRSGFTGKVDNVYKSAWDGGEMLIVKAENTEKWPSIDKDGKFSVEFNANDNFASIYSPAAGWTMSGDSYVPDIPTEQTPRANSVDPSAHILWAQNVIVSGGGDISFKMQHAVAYGKMTVNTPTDFEISKVLVTLNGVWLGYDRNYSYTLNATNVENNTFWFATEPVEVSELTVKAYSTDGKIMSKTVTVAEGKLKFDYGRVGTFSVSELTEEEVAAAPEFTYAYATGTNGDQFVHFTGEELGNLKLNTYYCFSNSMWPIGEYTFGKNSGQIYPGDYQGYSTYNNVELLTGRIVVNVKDLVYHIEMFDLADYSGNVVLAHATYTGTISPLDVPDPRQALAMPTLTAELTGDKVATISWSAVDNAVGYKVVCNCGIDTTTTDTSIELTFQDYGSYEVSVTALAAEGNATYKNSNTATVSVNVTDPNKLADYVLDQVKFGDNYIEFYRSYVGDGTNHSASTTESLRIYLHSNDRGDNYIKVGEYSCLGSGANVPGSAGSVNMRYCKDTYWNYHATANASSTLSVGIVDNEYVIIATINGETWGYKGMPSGWIIPEDSGDSGDDNTGEGGDNTGGETNVEDGLSSETAYTFTNCEVSLDAYTCVVFTLSGASDGTTLKLNSNKTDFGALAGVTNIGTNFWYAPDCTYSNGSVDWLLSYVSLDTVDGINSCKINYIMLNVNGANKYYNYDGVIEKNW